MCMACIEGEMWAAYQAEMAKRAAVPPVGSDAPSVVVGEDTEPLRSASPASAFPPTKPVEPKSE